MQEIESRLEQLDQDFARQAVPVVQRPLRAFNVIVPNPDRRSEKAQEYFDRIVGWYFTRYGDRAIWDGTLGEQPIVIGDVLYLVRIPYTEKNAVVRSDQLKGLPVQIVRSLTEPEYTYLAKTYLAAFEDFAALYNLDTLPSLLSEERWQLVRRAKFDLSSAAIVLREVGDTQGSITHSHQAAEKFVKAALLGCGVVSSALRRKFSHNLRKALAELISHQPKYAVLLKPVEVMERLLGTMNIRYADIPRSLADAATAFDASRYICAFIARQWQLDAERGAPTIELVPGQFYRDYSGRKYRCVAIENSARGELLTRMFLLEQDFGIVVDAEMTCKGTIGHFYVQITEGEQVGRLEERYRSLISKSQYGKQK